VAVDLFAGAGGLSLGLERAGYTVVLSADHDPPAVQTHLANFPGQCLDLDLAEPERVDDLIGLIDGLDVDLIAGGPPCQPFSRAGRSKIRDLVDKGVREGIDSRRELWRPFVRIIEEVRPRAVLMENVPDMALGDDMRTVRFIAERLEALGYETDMRILDTWRYSVPQHRQRMILVAIRDAVFEWPEHSDQVTLRDAIGDLPSLGGGTGQPEMRYAGPQTEFQRSARVGMSADKANVVFDHITRPVRADDREAFELMAGGVRYPDLPDHLKRYRDDIFDDKYNRLRWEQYSRSITAHIAKDGYWYIHPEEHRTLTVREAARIQTFPDDFRFVGSRSDAFRQIGNAVPPVVAEQIARSIRASIGKHQPAPKSRPTAVRAAARDSLLKWAANGPSPAWRTVGEPWDVLVGTIAGDRRELDAEVLLDRFPSPDSVVPQQISGMARTARTEREKRIVQSVGRAATAIRRDGWEQGTWGTAARLGPAGRLWVEAVGLGQKHVAATTGTLRVAARLKGEQTWSGVGARLVLGQLVGCSEDAPAVTAALAGLAAEICRPAQAKCDDCPINFVCASRSPSGRTATGAE
jgi:DNA (cytosine-5)-methyltransferase 1